AGGGAQEPAAVRRQRTSQASRSRRRTGPLAGLPRRRWPHRPDVLPGATAALAWRSRLRLGAVAIPFPQHLGNPRGLPVGGLHPLAVGAPVAVTLFHIGAVHLTEEGLQVHTQLASRAVDHVEQVAKR